MKPRRPSRARRSATKLWNFQRHRLRRIARGEIAPEYDREYWFLWTLKTRGRANAHDFILPGLLFLAEHVFRRAGEDPSPTAS